MTTEDKLQTVRRLLAKVPKPPVRMFVYGCELAPLLPHLTPDEILKIISLQREQDKRLEGLRQINPFEGLMP